MKRKREDQSSEVVKKRQKVKPLKVDVLENEKNFVVELISGEEDKKLGTFEISSQTTSKQLNQLVNKLNEENGEGTDYFTFHINALEVIRNIKETALEKATLTRRATSTKDAPIKILYYKQSIYKVRPVTRCTDTLQGHSESILCLEFSTNGKRLVTGSGDKTIRLWDLKTATPIAKLVGHPSDVLVVAWSPDSRKIASGDKAGIIKIWDGKFGKKNSKNLKRHKKWITSISWEPYHLNPKCNRFCSSSKDCSIKVWNADHNRMEFSLTGHHKGVTCVKWGGDGNIYSSSQDCSIRVWSVKDKIVTKILTGHSHWINSMSMSTDFVLRRGPFDEHCTDNYLKDLKKAKEDALNRYKEVLKQPLRIVTGSDDNTLCLWEPGTSIKPIKRLPGHLQLINDVKFSPDGKYFASASFDKSVIIWDAKTGRIAGRLKGHVGAVYKLAWSGDSRLLATCSKDSTCKVWNITKKSLLNDLPGHYDEVYCVDWSPDGQRVASGGKDRSLKIWRH